ncbi:hypothetical protein CR513_30895, partial [Mucuna pruriens]
MVGAVPSSLHQRVKFITDHQLVSVIGEKELVISTPSLELAKTPRPGSENHVPPSTAEDMAFQVMIKEGYQPSKGTNNEPSLSDNIIRMCEDPSRTDEPVENEGMEAEALVEMERQIKWEKPKFQPLAEELESINLGTEMEKREVQIGKQMPPDLRMKLVELLKEFVDVFPWSYQDMLSLDHEIVEHKLPLLPNSVPVRQQLRRMKADIALKIKEEVEK